MGCTVCASGSLATNSSNCTSPNQLCTLFHTTGAGVGRGSSVSGAGSTAWYLKPALCKKVLDDGQGGFPPECSNHVCCLYNVKGFEKGIGIYIVFNTGEVSLSQFLLVSPLC